MGKRIWLFVLGCILLANHIAFSQTFGSIGREAHDSIGATASTRKGRVYASAQTCAPDVRSVNCTAGRIVAPANRRLPSSA
jgi:hypothetical protein